MTRVLFYGVPSGCSFGSIVALEWLGQPYRLCRIGMPEGVSGEAYRRINPLDETPALATPSGEIITESLAILNHLAVDGIDAGLGFLQGTAAFDRLNAMLAFLNTTFFGAFSPLWHALEHGSEGSERDVLVAYGRNRVARAHAHVDALLQGRTWLLGEQRTLADAYFVGIARWVDYHGVIDRRDYPNVERLYRTLREDAAVRFADAIEQQQPAASSGGFIGHVQLEDWPAKRSSVLGRASGVNP